MQFSFLAAGARRSQGRVRSGRCYWGRKFDRLLTHMRKLGRFKFRAADQIIFDGQSCDGICEEANGEYLIRICKVLRYKAAVEVLIHEVAHCIDTGYWLQPGGDPHGESWGVAYAKVYRHWLIFEATEIERANNE